jgi:hypothetical protein
MTSLSVVKFTEYCNLIISGGVLIPLVVSAKGIQLFLRISVFIVIE